MSANVLPDATPVMNNILAGYDPCDPRHVPVAERRPCPVPRQKIPQCVRRSSKQRWQHLMAHGEPRAWCAWLVRLIRWLRRSEDAQLFGLGLLGMVSMVSIMAVMG